MLEKIEGGEEKETTEDEMVGWHHRLNEHGFGWIPGVGDGQGGLECCSSWGRKESDTTEQLNRTEGTRDRTNFFPVLLILRLYCYTQFYYVMRHTFLKIITLYKFHNKTSRLLRKVGLGRNI